MKGGHVRFPRTFVLTTAAEHALTVVPGRSANDWPEAIATGRIIQAEMDRIAREQLAQKAGAA